MRLGMEDEIQKLKDIVDEQSLQLSQSDMVIRRLVSAAKYMLGRCQLQDDERKAIAYVAIGGGEAHLGEKVPANELIENYRKIER